MKPGYYVVTKSTILTSERKATYRKRLHQGDWLVTDGYYLGRFDKNEELDWIPLEWLRGIPLIVDAAIEAMLDAVTVKVPFSRIEAKFQELVFVEPDELLPDMPRPILPQLGPYLRERRALLASYDRR